MTGNQGASPDEQLRRLREQVGEEQFALLVQGIQSSAAAVTAGGGQAAAARDEGFAQAAQEIINIFVKLGGTVPDGSDAALKDYLASLCNSCRYLPLAGVDPDDGDAEARSGQPELPNVYVSLNVREPRPGKPEETDGKRGELAEQREPWTAIEASKLHRRIVLLGDPGSGKSTFLRRLALALADELPASADGDESTNDGSPRFGEPLAPVFVTLRDFADQLDRLKDVKPEAQIERFVKDELERSNTSNAYPVLERLWRDGRAILLLDGLDEIADVSRRDAVLQAIREFAKLRKNTRLIVTCRIAAYERLEGATPAGPGDTQVAQGRGMITLEFKRSSMARDGLVGPLEHVEDGAQVEVAVGIRGTELQRPAKPVRSRVRASWTKAQSGATTSEDVE